MAPQADKAAPSERFEGKVCFCKLRKLVMVPGHPKVCKAWDLCLGGLGSDIERSERDGANASNLATGYLTSH